MRPLIGFMLMQQATSLSVIYRLGLFFLISTSPIFAQSDSSTNCHPIALVVAPSYDIEASKNFPQRLQVDTCPDGLFLGAYASGSSKPHLRLRTFDEFIGQLVSTVKVIAVVTGGGTTDRLWVFDFSGTDPVLSYKGTTKEAVSIHTREPYEVLIDFCPIDERCQQLRFGEGKAKPVR